MIASRLTPRFPTERRRARSAILWPSLTKLPEPSMPVRSPRRKALNLAAVLLLLAPDAALCPAGADPAHGAPETPAPASTAPAPEAAAAPAATSAPAPRRDGVARR